ncbi:MAG: hypothetical protein ACLF0P_02930 [Thermoanaerobaculia bacterium]
MERKEIVLEGVAPAEVAADLYEEYLSQGWRIADQEVLGTRDGRLDLKVILEREGDG